jgi:hypothetical protein
MRPRDVYDLDPLELDGMIRLMGREADAIRAANKKRR